MSHFSWGEYLKISVLKFQEPRLMLVSAIKNIENKKILEYQEKSRLKPFVL